MAFTSICDAGAVKEGGMGFFVAGKKSVLLVWPEGGEIHAFQGICPHQDIPLSEGKFDGRVVMCRAHQWTFDAKTGAGVNPSDCRLAEYPVKVEGDNVLIEVEGVTPLFAHT